MIDIKAIVDVEGTKLDFWNIFCSFHLKVKEEKTQNTK